MEIITVWIVFKFVGQVPFYLRKNETWTGNREQAWQMNEETAKIYASLHSAQYTDIKTGA